MNRFDRMIGVDDANRFRIAARFGEEALTDAFLVFVAPALDAIVGTGATADGFLERQVKDKRQIGEQSTRCHSADLPELVRIEAAGVTLVDDVGEKEAIRHHGVAGFESGPDHVGGELSPARHEKQHFTGKVHLVTAPQQQVAQHVANRRAAGIRTLGNVVTEATQPLRQEAALGRFARTVEAIQG
jgi:hypothetical protein